MKKHQMLPFALKKLKPDSSLRNAGLLFQYLSNTTRLDQETELEQATSALNEMIDVA
jgi:hypothetical protein